MASSLSTSLACRPASSFTDQSVFRNNVVKNTSSFVSVGTRLSSRRLRICCEASAPVAKPETVQRVVEIVAKQLATPVDKIKADSKFGDLGADSLDQVEIVMALEEEFKINIEDNGAESIVTVQDAANLIERAAASASS